MSFAAIEEHLRGEMDEGIFATGGQLYVSRDGEVLADMAVGVDGLGRPVERGSLFAVYCSGKPAIALGIAVLVADGEVSVDDRIGDILGPPVPEALAPILLSEVLDHTAGLLNVTPIEYMTHPATRRGELLEACTPPDGWEVGTQVGYSQVLGWYVVGRVIEALQPLPLRAFVRRRVLEPLGIGDDLFVAGMSVDEYKANRERLLVNAFIEGLSVSPILTESTQRFRCMDDPSGGTAGNARGLGVFYEGLASILRDRPGVVTAELLSELVSPRSFGYDHGMGRTCGYGLGFMTGLPAHDFGQDCGPDAFGHSAYGGMTAAFCDPDLDLVVAFHFNGRIDAESAISFRRPALVSRIYRAVRAETETFSHTRL